MRTLSVSIRFVPWAIVLGLFARGSAASDELGFFENRIRPVLHEHCVECHGPAVQESGLRVDHISFLRESLSFGRPVVPGDPDASTLLAAIEHRDADLQMPAEMPRLSAAIVKDFRNWISSGAAWPNEPAPSREKFPAAFDLEDRKNRHNWIWQIPQRSSLPEVTDRDWPREPLDFFVLHKLQQKNLRPAPPAAPGVWLRRVILAITGMPPTPQELAEFLGDPSPHAKAAWVDRLLSSPRFGERWARHWMDLMRYSESRGHESDFPIPNAWHYRDYLIEAFASDLPYDQFVMEHLAGDLVKPARTDALTGANLSVQATGWAFLGEAIHSPVDIRQDECDRIDNKIDVLSKSFLGLTVACARCHDHKFDALTQQDYYALCGFVQSSNYRQVRFQTMEHNREIASALEQLTRTTRRELNLELAVGLSPALPGFDQDLLAALDRSQNDERLSDRQLEIRSAFANLDPADPIGRVSTALRAPSAEQLQRKLTELADSWYVQQRESETSLEHARIVVDFASGNHRWMQDGWTFGSGPRLAGTLLIGDATTPIAGYATCTAAVKDAFWDVLEGDQENEQDAGSLASAARAGRMLRTPKFSMQTGRLFYLMSGESQVYAGVDSHLMVIGPLHGHLNRKLGGGLRWYEHDLRSSDGERCYVQFGAIVGRPLELRMVIEADQPPKLAEAPNGLLVRLAAAAPLDHPRLASALQRLFASVVIRLREGGLEGDPSSGDYAQLANWMLSHPRIFPLAEDSARRVQQLVSDYREQRQQLRSQVQRTSQTTIAWMDGNRVDEHVLLRGKAGRQGPLAPRRLPVAFSNSVPIDEPGSGRLTLARQIVSQDNSLAARVIVNRVWHHLFGQGIVASVDNFGYLGSRPTHPELLDHLAHEFVHTDAWSVKRLIRRIVLSSTYGMSSRPKQPAAEEMDPDNRMLHRMPVRRLEAEAIRDSILLVSGRLDNRMYGKPTPVHLTDFVIGRGRPEVTGPLDGGGRRSVYVAVRRNFLPPFMLTFDMPTPFSAVGRRTVTNVPAQALALTNDPFVYGQARVWAERLLREPELRSAEERVRFAFLQLASREPTPRETSLALESLAAFAREKGVSPSSTEAWHDLCHTLFSLNEFVFAR